MMKRFLTLFLCLALCAVYSHGKDRKTKRDERQAAVAAMVDSLVTLGQFTFVADRTISKLPSAPYITLNGSDYLQIDQQEIKSYLPYYGELYTAPVGASASPLSFQSKSFVYTNIPTGKSDKYLIQIEIKECTSNFPSPGYKLIIEVFDSSSATLSVTWNHGTPSMFIGYIKANAKE